MKLLGFSLALAIFASATGAAFVASTRGFGLPGVLDKPVSLRQGSVQGGGYRRRGAGPMFIYFGSRRHYGGGFRGGK